MWIKSKGDEGLWLRKLGLGRAKKPTYAHNCCIVLGTYVRKGDEFWPSVGTLEGCVGT